MNNPVINLIESRYLKSIIAIAFIITITAFTYAHISQMSFARPDDNWMLLTNTLVHPDHFSLEYLRALFTTFNDIQYSPLNTLYYSLIYQINGYDPFWYHFFSFVVHLLNVLIVYLVSVRLLKIFLLGRVIQISYITSLIWAIHPLNVESVVWISASKVVLFAFFSLSSFLFFIKAYTESAKKHYITSGVLFLASCFCKEQAVVTPLMYIYFMMCCRYFDVGQVAFDKANILFLIVMLLISMAFTFVTITASEDIPTAGILANRFSIIKRILLSFYCIRFYLTSLIIPFNLHYHYQYPFTPFEQPPFSLYVYAFILSAFCIYAIAVIRRMKNAAFYILCIGVFIIQILPVLQIIPTPRPAIMADRYMYIPSFIFILFAVQFCINSEYFGTFLKCRKLYIPLVFFICILFFVFYSRSLVIQWDILSVVNVQHPAAGKFESGVRY